MFGPKVGFKGTLSESATAFPHYILHISTGSKFYDKYSKKITYLNI